MDALRQYRQSGKSIDDTFAGDAREQHPLFFGMEDMDHSMINSLLESGTRVEKTSLVVAGPPTVTPRAAHQPLTSRPPRQLRAIGAVEPNIVDRHSRTALVHYAAMCRTIMTKAAKLLLYSNKLSNTSTPSQLFVGELFMK